MIGYPTLKKVMSVNMTYVAIWLLKYDKRCKKFFLTRQMTDLNFKNRADLTSVLAQ